MLRTLRGTRSFWLSGEADRRLGGMIGNTLGFGGGKAVGGSVSGSNYYMVGENGPELFALGRSGTIIPNKNMPSSGSNITLGDTNLTVQGNADNSTIAQMNYTLAEHTKRVTQIVRREMARQK